MVALGTFTLIIDGERIGSTPETTARVQIKVQGQTAIKDGDANKFWFPSIPPQGANVSLPYSIELPTDVPAGPADNSETLGYEVHVQTDNGGKVGTRFAAQAAASTWHLDDLTPTVVEPPESSNLNALRAEAAAALAESAAAAAAGQAVLAEEAAAEAAATTDVQMAGRLEDDTSVTRSVASALFVGLRAPQTAAVGGTDAVGELTDALADSDYNEARLLDSGNSYYIFNSELTVPQAKGLIVPHGAVLVPGGNNNVLAVEEDASYRGGIIDVTGTSGYTAAAIILRGTDSFGTSDVLTQISNVRLKGKSGYTNGVHNGEGVAILLDSGTVGKNRISYANFDYIAIRGFATAVKLLARAKTSGTAGSLIWVNANTFDHLKISQPRRGIDIIRETGGLATLNEFNFQLQSAVGIESGVWDEGRGNRFYPVQWDWDDPTTVGSATIDASTDTITLNTPDPDLTVGQFVRFDTITGTTGIEPGVEYRVKSKPTDSDLTLSATGNGPTLDLTGNGSLTGLVRSVMALESIIMTESSSEGLYVVNEPRTRIRENPGHTVQTSHATRVGNRIIGRVGAVAEVAKYGDQDDWLAYATLRGISVTRTAGPAATTGAVANMFDPVASNTTLWSGLIGTGLVTFTDAGDLVATPAPHGRSFGDKVQFANVYDSLGEPVKSPNAVPTTFYGVAKATWYYVASTPTSTTLTLSATPGGPTLTLTGSGTGDGFAADIGPITHEIDWTTQQRPLTVGVAFANGNKATSVKLEVYKGTSWVTVRSLVSNSGDAVDFSPRSPNSFGITKIRWTLSGLTLGKTGIEVERKWMFEAQEPGKAYAPYTSQASTPQVDSYTTAGAATWTKPAAAVRVDVIAIAGGAGGGSGRRGAAGTVRVGGGSGAGGPRAVATFLASQLGATETVTVGAGGAGGAAQTTNDTNGNGGGDGGVSGFGAFGSRWLTTQSGNGGNGGSATAGAGGAAAAPGSAAGQSASTTGGVGSSANSATGRATPTTGGAGGGGGGITSANVVNAGGAGSPAASGAATIPTAGTAGGGAGAAGVGSQGGSRLPAGGGAGGGASDSGAAGAGGAGASPGGAGGGGGASLNGFASGAGGAGGDGAVYVITWF